MSTKKYGPLTPEKKARVLANFAAERATPGAVDPEVLPLCDAVNALPGLATIFSCSGHAGQPYPDGYGYLAVWPSRTWHGALGAVYPEIAARFPRPHPPMLTVDGRWSVCFPGLGAFPSDHGPEPGRRSLAKSAEDLLAILRRLAAEGAGWDA